MINFANLVFLLLGVPLYNDVYSLISFAGFSNSNITDQTKN